MPQVSTGTFPITQTLSVPDEQCRYQGTLALSLIVWQMTAAQKAQAREHFACECKLKTKPCTVFVTSGVSLVTSITAGSGKVRTTRVPTLDEVVLSRVLGEATADNPPKAGLPCDALARTLYSFVVGAGPKWERDILEEATCPR